MKDLIKKILNEQVSDKVITKVLSQLERGKIKPPYFNNLDLIGLTDDEIQTTLEQFTNGKVDIEEKIILDSRGNEIYVENSDGYWRKKEYDEKDNQIYSEDSDGFWEKREYDDRDNEIYKEDSDGFWYRSKYDKHGNEIYIENSDGYWVKKEYNERGKLIYREDSNGDIIDKRNPQ